ncbi:murein L,D-transpeptidase family protein [Paracoccus sp. p4-l81]|uniref:L,D-transpeptidase family protein n=1 Tax=unclassified Paracoccus (in: a-proteobacteria) TaxID=2688777 RepID=UPI0035B98939
MRFILRLAALFGLAFLVASCGGDSLSSNKFKRYDGPPVTQVQVHKGKRQLMLFSGQTLLKTYKVGLGYAPEGHKQFEGDGKTPEGVYYIDRQNPNSAYHLSLGISYPNINDTARAAVQGRSAGGDIMIHGQAGKNRGRGKDWTAGCIAVTDAEIEDIYAMVRPGTPIIIFP